MKKSDNQWIKTAGQLSSMAMLILISTLIGLGFGYWLDSKLGTAPWLAFVLTILGLASGLYESIRLLIKATRDNDS
jgi:ATP synthase protein I